MTIFLKKDDFFFQLFPDLLGVTEDASLVKSIQNKYSSEGYTPEVKLKDDVLEINFDDELANEVQGNYKKVVAAAEKGQYKLAKELINKLVKTGSKNSEIYRIYGQILSDEGNVEEAINQLIESLKWNPKNTNAQIMMGNIYAYSKNDIPTAEIFYQKVIELEPKNYIALNNIAGIIAKSGNQERALSYFEKVLAINPNYPNALYGISLTFYNQRRYHEAFDKVCLTLKALNKEKVKNPTLESRCQSLQLEIAKLVLEQTNEEEIFFPFLAELEQKTSKKIEVVIDDRINTAAKIEIAEYKGKTNHIIRYKKAATGYAHLVLHELTHLELIHEARQEDENFLFTATHTNENNFYKKAEKDKKRIIKGGVPEENLKPFLNSRWCTRIIW